MRQTGCTAQCCPLTKFQQTAQNNKCFFLLARGRAQLPLHSSTYYTNAAVLEARSRPHMRFNSRLLESSHNEIVMLSNLRHQRGNLTFCTENMMLNLHHLQTKSCKKITNHFSHCYLVHGVRFLKREMASIDVLLHCISSAN